MSKKVLITGVAGLELEAKLIKWGLENVPNKILNINK